MTQDQYIEIDTVEDFAESLSLYVARQVLKNRQMVDSGAYGEAVRDQARASSSALLNLLNYYNLEAPIPIRLVDFFQRDVWARLEQRTTDTPGTLYDLTGVRLTAEYKLVSMVWRDEDGRLRRDIAIMGSDDPAALPEDLTNVVATWFEVPEAGVHSYPFTYPGTDRTSSLEVELTAADAN